MKKQKRTTKWQKMKMIMNKEAFVSIADGQYWFCIGTKNITSVKIDRQLFIELELLRIHSSAELK